MATREKSLFVANEIYFITFTVLDWKQIFINDKFARPIFSWFDYMKNNYGNKVYGYVIILQEM